MDELIPFTLNIFHTFFLRSCQNPVPNGAFQICLYSAAPSITSGSLFVLGSSQYNRSKTVVVLGSSQYNQWKTVVVLGSSQYNNYDTVVALGSSQYNQSQIVGSTQHNQ